MRPYSVEIFRPDFTMVGSTNVNEVTYKEDYLASDENTITVLAMAGIEKQDFIRISRGSEEYAGVVTEIGYGTDRSKRLQTISYKPLVELLNTGILFDVNAQGQGTLEDFICDRIRETFIENSDTLQNISGLSVAVTSGTPDWSLHITPAESGGHYNIINLMDSVIVPAMQKYGILVKAALDIQNREIHITVGQTGGSILTIEADLPNIIKKSVTIKQVSADVNKLILFDSTDYATTRTYYLHPDLGYDTYDRDRITPVVCELQAVQHEEGSSFESAAIRAAHDKFSGLAYSNLIELTMANDDGLVKPEQMEFGQQVEIISDGVAYRSILTGRERGKNTKLVLRDTRSTQSNLCAGEVRSLSESGVSNAGLLWSRRPIGRKRSSARMPAAWLGGTPTRSGSTARLFIIWSARIAASLLKAMGIKIGNTAPGAATMMPGGRWWNDGVL